MNVVKPKLDQVLMRKSASDVLDSDGRIKHTGPHIHPRPTWFRRNQDGTITEVAADTTQPIAGAGAVAAPVTVKPPLPADIGATMDVSGDPLWSAWIAPAAAPLSDTYQGQYATCYYISVIDSIDGENPGYVRSPDIIERLADGTNAVTFYRNLSAPVSVVVGNTVSAAGCKVNPQTKACALPIFELAYADFRAGANTYASINDGWPGSVMTDLGMTNIAVAPSAGAAAQTALMAAVAGTSAISACTIAQPTSGLLIGAHCYRVINVWIDASGAVWVLLRNPWGFDGAAASGDPSDGLVTLTWAQFAGDVASVAVSTSYAPNVRLASASPATIATPTPAPSPTPVPTPSPTENPMSNIAISSTVPTAISPDQNSGLSNCKVEIVNGKPDIGYVAGVSYAEFLLTVAAAGTYTLQINFAAIAAGWASVSINGTAQGSSVAVPMTTSWSIYAPVSVPVTLPAGATTLRISNFNGSHYNIGGLTLTPGTPATPTPTPPRTPTGAVITLKAVTLHADGTISGTWSQS